MKHEQGFDKRFYIQVLMDVLEPAAFFIITSVQMGQQFSALNVAFISDLKLNSETIIPHQPPVIILCRL